jgi:putative intracellular protease/amidase
MNKRALIVVTSNDKLGNTNEKTGWFLAEVAHVFWPLYNDGFIIDFSSPKGGMAPLERKSLKLDDSENRSFVEKFNADLGLITQATKEIDSSKYSVIYFAGGHGTMWDFPEDESIQRLIKDVYESDGIVSAVCHGPSALVNVKLSNGKYLVDGKNINSFTDDEEREVQKDSIVPFMLESKLRERGGKFEAGKNWADQVIVDGRLITGQNPQSASHLGKTIVKTWHSLDQQESFKKENYRETGHEL